MAAVESASAEERDRLRATYKQRLQDMEARLKVGTKFNGKCANAVRRWLLRRLLLVQVYLAAPCAWGQPDHWGSNPHVDDAHPGTIVRRRCSSGRWLPSSWRGSRRAARPPATACRATSSPSASRRCLKGFAI